MKTKIVLLGWMLASGFAGTAMAQTRVDLRTQSKSVDFSGALSTKPIRTGTALPATCSVAELFFVTSASPGLNVYLCTGANVWTLEGSVAPPANYSQSFTGQTAITLTHNLGTTNIVTQCYSGANVQIPYASLTVNNVNQATATFSTAQTGRCVVNGYGGPGISRYATSFIAQTSVSIPAATHNLGTGNLSVACLNSGTPQLRVEPDQIRVDAANNVTITFFTAQSGTCTLE